jgi:hypothetical protein
MTTNGVIPVKIEVHYPKSSYPPEPEEQQLHHPCVVHVLRYKDGLMKNLRQTTNLTVGEALAYIGESLGEYSSEFHTFREALLATGDAPIEKATVGVLELRAMGFEADG